MARALCIRETKQRKAEHTDFKTIDNAILSVEREAARLAGMKTWTETIKSNSGKLLDEIRKLAEGLDTQVGILKTAVETLK